MRSARRRLILDGPLRADGASMPRPAGIVRAADASHSGADGRIWLHGPCRPTFLHEGQVAAWVSLNCTLGGLRRSDASARGSRAEASATGTPVSYTEPAYGTDVIVEYPDGRRERIKDDGSLMSIPPRDDRNSA